MNLLIAYIQRDVDAVRDACIGYASVFWDSVASCVSLSCQCFKAAGCTNRLATY